MEAPSLPRLHEPKILIVTPLCLSGSGGKPFETETYFGRFDGEYHWFLSRACPLFDRIGNILGWYGNDTDIHNRKQAEEKPRQDEMELRRITDVIRIASRLHGRHESQHKYMFATNQRNYELS
jgi:hypothetical protein